MKKLLFLSIIFITYNTFAQTNTEVYVFDISPAYEGLELLNIQPVSSNKGYNNQPSFQTDDFILYSSNNEGQNDIAKFHVTYRVWEWFNTPTKNGSEFSPQTFPSSNDVAAVRLDKDGLQRLYKYNYKTGTSSELIKDLQVAYFAFYNDKEILATVLNGNTMDLVFINLQTKTADTLFRNAGRSLQKVPKTNSMSYSLVNEEGNLDLYLLDMDSFESFFVTQLPIGIQDYVWINDTQILIGSGNKLYMYDTLGDSEWTKVASLEEYGLKNISRMAISPNGNKLAIVSESK